MPSCNWAFGCAIGLFVITLIIVLVIVLGGMDGDKEKIIVMPTPAPAAGPVSVPAPKLSADSRLGGVVANNRMHIQELSSAKEAVKLLKGSKPALVLFYADFCGHCKQMMPDFEQAAQEASSKSGIIIAKVESGKLKDMASVSKDLPAINGFPTMCTNYEGGEPKIKAHVGRKDKDSISKIIHSSRISNNRPKYVIDKGVRAETGRKMVEFASLEEACGALKGREKTIVMAYADWCGFCKAMKADYESLVEKAPAGVKVGRLNASVIKQGSVCEGVEEIKAYPTILYNNGSKITKVMGRQSLQALMDLLKK